MPLSAGEQNSAGTCCLDKSSGRSQDLATWVELHCKSLSETWLHVSVSLGDNVRELHQILIHIIAEYCLFLKEGMAVHLAGEHGLQSIFI